MEGKIWGKRSRGDILSRPHLKGVLLIAGDVKSDHLVEVVSASFIHCRITAFVLVTTKCSGGGTERPCKYPVCT